MKLYESYIFAINIISIFSFVLSLSIGIKIPFLRVSVTIKSGRSSLLRTV